MARMLLTICSILSLGLNAQITVTNATFPSAGDTLKTATDNNPSGIAAATPPGGNQTWIFTGLLHSNTAKTIYKNASAGNNAASYPGADLVVIANNGGESYYNKTSAKFEFMGFAGVSAQAFGLQVVTHSSPAIVERRAPLNFFDINQQESNLRLPFSVADLPDTLFSGLPFTPDSLRININTKRSEVVDGWGNCQIPGGNYPVLRLKRTEYTQTGIEIKIGFFWLNLSQFIPAGGGGGLGALLKPDTTLSYHFISGTEKEEIAVATMNKAQTEVQSVRYKDNGLVAAPIIEAPGSPSISAYPNPAVEWVRFDCANMPRDLYTLKIFNIIGKVVWKEEHEISGNQSIRIELENFKKGTYLYSLVDSKGNIVGTKRLVVLKP